MRVKLWIALLGTLPLLAVGSSATAGTQAARHNGLIAARGAHAIYLIDTQLLSTRPIPGTADMSAPAWSPDGSLLAVESADKVGTSVYTIKPDGSDRRLVLRNASSPSWSPDGKQLAVVRDGCAAPYHCDSDSMASTILATVRVDGSDARQLTNYFYESDIGASEPTWSPAGNWIAFVADDGSVHLVSPNGEHDGIRWVAGNGSNLAWSPDGSKLAFDVLGENQDASTAIVDVTTGRRTSPPPSRPSDSGLAWSPDGNQIAFLSSPSSTTMRGCGGDMEMDLWAMGADGSKPHRLSKGAYSHFAWGTFQPAPQPSD